MAGFEWNPAKAAHNLRRHGVDFEVAKDVLRTRQRSWSPTTAMLMRRGGVPPDLRAEGPFVVFTERDGDVTRIISARKANKREERAYLVRRRLR